MPSPPPSSAAPPSSATPPSSGAPAAVASIEVGPAAALLAGVGATRALAAHALTLDGSAANPTGVTWTSSDPSIATVGADGTVTGVAIGTAQVTATVGDVKSEPVQIYVAQPAAGAILITDSQIVSGPTAVDPDGDASADQPYEVVLRDVTGVQPGALVISTESASVGGEVVSATPEGGDTRVRLVVAPPSRLFTRFSFRHIVDLGAGIYELPEELAASYDLKQDGKTLELTPKTSSSSGSTGAALARYIGPVASPPVALALADDGEFDFGPFKCKRTAEFGSNLPLELGVPPLVTIAVDGTFSHDVDEAGSRMVVQATPTITIQVALTAKSTFEVKLECKMKVAQKTWRVPGIAGLFFGGRIIFGIGFEVGGKVNLVQAKMGVQAQYKPTFSATITCLNRAADCELDGDVTHQSTYKPIWEVPAVNQIRFEPSLNAFGYITIMAGQPDIEDLQFEAMEAKAGIELGASYTLEALQIDDTSADGRSKYGLAFKAEVGPGIKLNEVLRTLGISKLVPLKLTFEHALGDSPTGSVRADRARYLPGETAHVTVTIPAGAGQFPIWGYNVSSIAVVRRAGLTVDVLAEIDAEPGQTEFELEFTSPGLIDADELFAFTTTSFLPIPPKLEIGQAATPIIFTFDDDLQGWQTFGRGARSSTEEWGEVAWRADGGGTARLSGERRPERINSSLFREFTLAADVTTLRFKASADLDHPEGADSRLQVRISSPDGGLVLLDKVYTNSSDSLQWVEESLNIRAWAGQTITIIFEQNDGGSFGHEHIYLDDIAIESGT